MVRVCVTWRYVGVLIGLRLGLSATSTVRGVRGSVPVGCSVGCFVHFKFGASKEQG